MWYSLDDGSGASLPLSYGFAPDRDHEGQPFAPGDVHIDDNGLYKTPDYFRTVEITQAQYDAMRNFGDHPESKKGDGYILRPSLHQSPIKKNRDRPICYIPGMAAAGAGDLAAGSSSPFLSGGRLAENVARMNSSRYASRTFSGFRLICGL
jgi:hypothetical protein